MHDEVTIWKFLLAGVVLAAQAACGVQADFSRYEVILSRKPFGQASAEEGEAPPSPPPAAAASFLADLKMCAITEGAWGVRVGLVTVQPPETTYYLGIGDSEDGIVLLEADYGKEGALLRKGAEQGWIYMDGSKYAPAVAAPGSGVAAPVAAPRRVLRPSVPFRGVTRTQYEKIKRDLPPPRSPRMSMPQDREGEAGLPMTREELEAARRSYNLELIRKGGKEGVPLPMTLTPEEDAKLVSEGVLPP